MAGEGKLCNFLHQQLWQQSPTTDLQDAWAGLVPSACGGTAGRPAPSAFCGRPDETERHVQVGARLDPPHSTFALAGEQAWPQPAQESIS